MYSYEELPYERNNDYFPYPPLEYSELMSQYGCENSIHSYQGIPKVLPGYHDSYGYGRSYVPRRYNGFYLGNIYEEEESMPYDLNGMGTKITSRKSLSQLENRHTYYPSYIKQQNESFGGYDESFKVEVGNGEMYGDERELNERKRKREEESDLDVPNGFKLPASKSPIMEAMAFCAIKRWGIEILQCQDQIDDAPAKVVFRVLDFELYYKYSCLICSKQNPTEDIGSRVKSLRRWFVNFPKKRDRRENPQFSLEVKPEVAKKVYEMIEKYKCQINVKKRRRTM